MIPHMQHEGIWYQLQSLMIIYTRVGRVCHVTQRVLSHDTSTRVSFSAHTSHSPSQVYHHFSQRKLGFTFSL